MRMRRAHGFGTVDFVLLAVALGLVAMVILPAFIRSSVSLEIQRCYALQRRLHAACDAYETDHRERLPEMQAALGLLLEGGYISELPVDPGDGRPSSRAHFGRNAVGAVYCRVHGSPWPHSVRPAREPADRRFIGPLYQASPKSPGPPVIKHVPGFWR